MRLQQVPLDRLRARADVPDHMMQIPPTPQCPNCSRQMVLSHKFYAEPGGPRMRHFHCVTCKVGLTQAEHEEGDPSTPSPR
jgi:hypothetical protein